MRMVARRRQQKALGELADGIYEIFIEPLLSCIPERIDSAQGVPARRSVSWPEASIVAMQDYVRSIGATRTISKAQIFRFLEMQFAHADRNHDGELDIDELAAFVHAISCPESDQR